MHWHHVHEKHPALSDRHVTFANKLAGRLKERYPDKDYRVMMLSYGHSRPAPIAARPEQIRADRDGDSEIPAGLLDDGVIWRPARGVFGPGEQSDLGDGPFLQLCDDPQHHRLNIFFGQGFVVPGDRGIRIQDTEFAREDQQGGPGLLAFGDNGLDPRALVPDPGGQQAFIFALLRAAGGEIIFHLQSQLTCSCLNLILH